MAPFHDADEAFRKWPVPEPLRRLRRGGHDGFMVIERNRIQNQLIDERLPVAAGPPEQPVHSALCRYTTEGRRGMVSARATCSAKSGPHAHRHGRPCYRISGNLGGILLPFCAEPRHSLFGPTAIRIRFSLFSGRQDVGHMRGSKWSEPLPHPLGVSSVKTTKPGRCPCDCGRNAAHCRARPRSMPQGNIFLPREEQCRPPPLRNSPV